MGKRLKLSARPGEGIEVSGPATVMLKRLKFGKGVRLLLDVKAPTETRIEVVKRASSRVK